MSLYNLSNDYAELNQREDLDPEVLADTLDSIQDDMSVKLDNIGNWIDNNTADIDFIASKVKALQAEKKRLESQNKRLQQYVLDSLDTAGLKSFKTDNHIIKTRKYRGSVNVINQGEVPIMFLTYVPQSYVPDKTKIYQALKSGEKVPGAELIANRKAVIK